MGRVLRLIGILTRFLTILFPRPMCRILPPSLSARPKDSLEPSPSHLHVTLQPSRYQIDGPKPPLSRDRPMKVARSNGPERPSSWSLDRGGRSDGVGGPIGHRRSRAKGDSRAGDRANWATSLPGHLGQEGALGGVGDKIKKGKPAPNT